MATSYQGTIKNNVRASLRNINSTFIEQSLQNSTLWGGPNSQIDSSTINSGTNLTNFVAALITGPSAFQNIELRNSTSSGGVLYGYLMDDGMMQYSVLVRSELATKLSIMNVSQLLPNGPMLNNMNKLYLLYQLLTPEKYNHYLRTKLPNYSLQNDPIILQNYTILNDIIMPDSDSLSSELTVDSIDKLSTIHQLMKEATIDKLEQSDAFIMRRLLLLYLHLSSYMVALKMDENSTKISVINSIYDALVNTLNNNADYTNLDAKLDERINNVVDTSTKITNVSNNVNELKQNMSISLKNTSIQKNNEMKVRILSYVLLILLLILICGSTFAYANIQVEYRNIVAAIIAIFAITIAICGYCLVSFVWVIEKFAMPNQNYDANYYTQVLAYLNKTYELAVKFRKYKTYKDIDQHMTNDLNMYNQAFTEIDHGVKKIDDLYNIVIRNRIFAHARIVFAINMLVIISVSTVAVTLFVNYNMVTLRNIAIGFSIIFTLFAILMYLLDTTVRVHRRSPNYYWMQPTDETLRTIETN